MKKLIYCLMLASIAVNAQELTVVEEHELVAQEVRAVLEEHELIAQEVRAGFMQVCVDYVIGRTIDQIDVVEVVTALYEVDAKHMKNGADEGSLQYAYDNAELYIEGMIKVCANPPTLELNHLGVSE